MDTPIDIVMRLNPSTISEAIFSRYCPNVRDEDAEIRERIEKAQENFGKPGRDPVMIADVLTALGDNNPAWARGIAVARLTQNWANLVGEGVAAHCKPVGLKDGVLTVRPATTAWGQQLRFLEPQMKAAINKALGAKIVIKIVITPATSITFARGVRDVKRRGVRDTYN